MDDVCLVRTGAPEGIRFQVLRIRPLCQHADWTLNLAPKVVPRRATIGIHDLHPKFQDCNTTFEESMGNKHLTLFLCYISMPERRRCRHIPSKVPDPLCRGEIMYETDLWSDDDGWYLFDGHHAENSTAGALTFTTSLPSDSSPEDPDDTLCRIVRPLPRAVGT
jgi:hypothetical protein